MIFGLMQDFRSKPTDRRGHLTGSRPDPANVRKVVEPPYHRLEVAKPVGKDDPQSSYWDTVADLLLDWQFLEAKTEADPYFRPPEANESSATAGEAKP